ncbi:MAG TPA: LuxR C-terminal-related transcriptional regulator [Anaerolineae bacterium]|nr:LuxR C-terminal-related transcriptional regulator [Anaerolineae bacterium]
MSEPLHSLDDIARQHSLLATKLRPPHLRARLVRRPRLTAHLDEALQHRLTLISAAAGSGKTTLLSEWQDAARRQRWPIAWVSLDKGDNDPVRFWSHVTAALDAFQTGISRTTLMALHATPLPDPSVMQDGPAWIEAILAVLVNELATLPRDVVVVLDDYHVIESSAVHDSLAYWLEHVPDCVHLVIASREDPPMPLARLRVRGELAEIRGADLRFTRGEVATYFNEVMGLHLPDEDIAAIEARTEGWIAGLQMAALSMQGRRDTAGFIAAFTGSHRFVADYLIEEVLGRQPEAIQSFLLQTAILNRFNAALCDAVTSQTDSQAVLERLDAANLFLVSLDDERRWYRYHPLFAELLRDRLSRLQPDRVPDLHRRACDWHERNGLVADAIEHAIAMKDWERAADLLEHASRRTWMPWTQSEIGAMLEWLEALPPDLVRARPRLCLACAWALLDPSQIDRVEQYLQDATQAVNSLRGEKQVQAVLCEVAVIRTFVSSIRGDAPLTIELARQALASLPETEVSLRSMIAWSLGYAYALTRDMPSAEQALTEALSLSRVAGNHALALMSMNELAEIQCDCGRLRESARTLQQTLELAEEWGGQNFFILSRTWWLQAWLFYEWNDLERAATCLGESHKIAAQWRYLRGVVSARGLLAIVKQAQGDSEGAQEMIRQARQAALESRVPIAADALAVYRLNLWRARGDLESAMQWIREHELNWSDKGSRIHYAAGTAVARVLIEHSRKQNEQTWMHKAFELLEDLLQKAEAAGLALDSIDILPLQATALHVQGQTAQALRVLKRALVLAEPEGYVRMFLECGEPMAQLLRWSIESKEWNEPRLEAYARRLLAQFGQPQPEAGMAASSLPVLASGDEGWLEPLTGREMEVLRLVAAGASDQEIAEKLGLAKATVKTHLRHIYRKLQVGRRTQAIVRARLLRLLP